MKHIPNFITSLNLASGFIALILASNGDLTSASWLIAFAMVLDFLDGFTARLLKAYSDIGKELDSLADIVSFGVAPAVIIFKLIDNCSEPIFSPFASPAGIIAVIYHLVPVFMPVCAGLRLAKFNTDPTQVVSFKGLATPANAIAVISLIFAANYSHEQLLNTTTKSPLFLSLYSLILSILMVTRIPLLSLKVKNLKLRGNEGRYLLAGLIIISFVLCGPAASILIIPLYILASLIVNFGFKSTISDSPQENSSHSNVAQS